MPRSSDLFCKTIESTVTRNSIYQSPTTVRRVSSMLMLFGSDQPNIITIHHKCITCSEYLYNAA